MEPFSTTNKRTSPRNKPLEHSSIRRLARDHLGDQNVARIRRSTKPLTCLLSKIRVRLGKLSDWRPEQARTLD